MLLEYANLPRALTLTLSGTALIWAAYYFRWIYDDRALKSFFILIGGVVLLFGFLVTVLWFVREINYEFEHRQSARSITPLTTLADRLRFLDRDLAVELLKSPYALEIEHEIFVNDHNTPEITHFVRTMDGTEIPFDFVRTFVQNSNHAYLCQIRTFTDSHARDMAIALTNHLIGLNLASPAKGNKPASWRIDFQIIHQLIERRI